MQYLLAFLAIVILIIAHEFGHYWVARKCGMKVERFSIFFGRPIARFVRDGTVFQIGTIPLGGFVQITGMNPLEEIDKDDPHIYPNGPAWQRGATILAAPLANYVAAVLIVFPLFTLAGIPRSPMSSVEQSIDGKPAAK